MKILQVTPILVPHYLWAGSHRVVYDISRTLAKKGHEVWVCTSDMLDVKTRIKMRLDRDFNNFRIVRFKNLSTILSHTSNLIITPELYKFLYKHAHDFDLIHVHEYTTYQNIIVQRISKSCNVPYVLQAHGSLLKISKKSRKWIYDVFFGYNILQNATKVIALNRFETDQYTRMGVPEEKIAIIPNGIDLSEYANLPPKGAFKRKFGIPEEKKIILYLGRIHKTKCIDFLIKAYTHLINDRHCKDALLVIAGPDDGFLNEAKDLANVLGVHDSIVFTGFISNKDKLKALVDADVFVTPSFYGFPMTFLEACAIGTPIVTTTLGDTLEWIDRNVGYVTRPTPRDLAEAMHRIISDDELRRSFSKNCIEIVKSEFSIEKVVERLEKVYEEVVEG